MMMLNTDKEKDGKPRIIDGDGETIVDMGAYEFSDICEGDFDGEGDGEGDGKKFKKAWFSQ